MPEDIKSVTKYSRLSPSNEEYEETEAHAAPIARTSLRRYSLLGHLLLAITYTLFGLGLSTLIWRPWPTSRGMSSPVPSEIREARIEKFWMPDDTFNPPQGRSAESDKAWDERHKRYVMVVDPEQFGLGPSEDVSNTTEPGTQLYAVSGFHQLHCLRLIRYSWYEAVKRGGNVLEDASGIPNSPPVKFLGSHIDHCFDYLRQAIECHADPALEPFIEADGTPMLHGSSGWGVNHVCRDYNALVEWVNERNIPAREGDFKGQNRQGDVHGLRNDK